MSFRYSNALIAISTVFTASLLLTACGNDESGDASKRAAGTAGLQAKPAQSDKDTKNEDDDFESRNKPLSTELAAPAMLESGAYVDVLTKLAPMRFYTALRDWDENDEDIAKSISGAILVQHDAPELFDYENQMKNTDDAFQKREFAQKIASFVKEDAGKVGGNYRVKMMVKADLKPYDFDTHAFVSESCLFSEKLAYTAEEMRNQNAYAKAQKPRCYLQPSTTNFLVGVTSGSKLNLEIVDEAVAKAIEKNRANLNYEIFGYVRYVQRDRIGGKPAELRHLLIEPQKINLVVNGVSNPIYSKTF